MKIIWNFCRTIEHPELNGTGVKLNSLLITIVRTRLHSNGAKKSKQNRAAQSTDDRRERLKGNGIFISKKSYSRKLWSAKKNSNHREWFLLNSFEILKLRALKNWFLSLISGDNYQNLKRLETVRIQSRQNNFSF